MTKPKNWGRDLREFKDWKDGKGELIEVGDIVMTAWDSDLYVVRVIGFTRCFINIIPIENPPPHYHAYAHLIPFRLQFTDSRTVDHRKKYPDYRGYWDQGRIYVLKKYKESSIII